MKASDNALKLLIDVECGGNLNACLTAYQCQAGKWTIGVGNTYYETGSFVKKGDVITEKRALELFNNIIPTYERILDKYIFSKLNQNQFDGLISFVYNVPPHAFSKSKLLMLVNENPFSEEIPKAWKEWIYFTNSKTMQKEISQGLLNRREKEISMYNGIY